MSEDRIRQLTRRNFELAEKVGQLERLKNHWHQEVIGLRHDIAELHSKIEAFEATRLDRIAIENLEQYWHQEVIGLRHEIQELQSKIEALETERIERLAIENLAQ